MRGFPLPAALMLLAVLVAACGTPDSDEQAGVEALSPDTLSVWLTLGQPLVILDTRPDSLYRAGRIRGAAPAAGRTVSDLRQLLPTEREVPVIVYNDDGRAADSGADIAWEAAGRYGFRRVYRLEGGLDAWIALGYDVDGLRPVSRAP